MEAKESAVNILPVSRRKTKVPSRFSQGIDGEEFDSENEIKRRGVKRKADKAWKEEKQTVKIVSIAKKAVFLCYKCDERFDVKSEMLEHSKIHRKFDGMKVLCTGEYVSQAVINHFSDIYWCFLVSDVDKPRLPYTSKTNDDEKRFQCDLCPWRFTSKAIIAGHMSYVHISKLASNDNKITSLQ